MSENFAAWRAARNAALLALDMTYAREQMPDASGDDVRLMAMHKARYECKDLPDAARHESAKWLRDRALGRFNGPLLPEGELPE